MGIGYGSVDDGPGRGTIAVRGSGEQTGVADKTPEDGVRDSGHGRQNGGRSHHHRAQAHLSRYSRLYGVAVATVLPGVVPVLFDGKAFASHKNLLSH